MVFGDGTSGSHKGGDFMNGIYDRMRRDTRELISFFCFLPCEDTKAICKLETQQHQMLENQQICQDLGCEQNRIILASGELSFY